MSTKSASSSFMHETGFSPAQSQTKPMPPAMSAPHPLLKSSRGRVLWPDQRTKSSDKNHIAPLDDHLDDFVPSITRPRQRTSSVTSVETIRLRPRPRATDALALLKPKPPLNELTIAKRSTRKRTHSATSPEIEDDGSGALQTGPRVRQRRDNFDPASSASAAPLGDDREHPRGTLKAKMPSALKKLREKLAPALAVEVSEAPRDTRSSLSPKPSPSVAYPSKTENDTTQSPPPVAFPSKQTAAISPARCKPDVGSPPTSPKPLQSLSTNTESKRNPIRVPIPGSRLNTYGCYELQASEFDLAVTFPSSSRSNFEVWDQEDELFLVGPLSLHLTLKDPAKWDGVPISHPDISVLEIKCASTAVVDPSYPYCGSSAAQHNSYRVFYDGARMRNAMGKELPIDLEKGIAIDTLWLRTYAADQGRGRRGWMTNFYVPIATRLFDKRETRAFQVEALISVWGDKLATEVATMSVSHLMREREMVRR
ncbi:hypothetical protein C8R47DRAFT_477394 [Mycena vitilis]|nr:hypothetical protein C8R47DRAFT_477394 [Mycena vitilis]